MNSVVLNNLDETNDFFRLKIVFYVVFNGHGGKSVLEFGAW
jgi:hypothetical protein